MVPGLLMIILFAAFDLDEFDGEMGPVALVIVRIVPFFFVLRSAIKRDY